MIRLFVSLLIIMLVPMTAIAEEYSRSQFGSWIDADRDCQNTRTEILIRDAGLGLMVYNCDKVYSGIWVLPYSNRIVYDSSKIDIDHIVPLYYAWTHGADKWTREERVAFANDFENLLAVSASENRSKGGRGPDKWLPVDFAFWCEYIYMWEYLIDKYKLTSSESEDNALILITDTCKRRLTYGG